MLHFAKKFENFWRIHFVQVRRSHNAVVVFAGDGSSVFADKIINSLPRFFDNRDIPFVLHIHERNDMEVAVAGVACDGVF